MMMMMMMLTMTVMMIDVVVIVITVIVIMLPLKGGRGVLHGFNCTHALSHLATLPNPSYGRPGRGLAVVFRSDLDVTKTTIDVTPTTFDVLGVNVRMGKERFLLVNIYRPPDTNINTFISELTDLLDSAAGRYTIFMGDFNCPGVTCDCVDIRLTAALACYSLKIVNEGPTRLNYDGGQNKLDV